MAEPSVFCLNFPASFDYLSNYPQVLLSLGFGGSESLSKIPERFLSHRSKAKGVTITNFVKKEEDLMNRFVRICVMLETFDCFLKV